MDEQMLLAFEPHWGEAPEQTPTETELPNLSEEERALYEKLLSHAWAENLQLAQERIGFEWVRRGIGKSWRDVGWGDDASMIHGMAR